MINQEQKNNISAIYLAHSKIELTTKTPDQIMQKKYAYPEQEF